MAGVKQFNENEVLDRAMTVFWRQGYEATSIQDLTEATGLGRGSLYGAFGDKEGLFLAVLDRYANEVQAELLGCLQDADPKRAIATLFETIVQHMSDGRYPPGCLNTNTTLESPAGSERISRKIVERLGRMEGAIYTTLLRAQSEGIIAPGVDLKALSRYFLALSQGIAVLNKAYADPSVIRDVATVVISMWNESCEKGCP